MTLPGTPLRALAGIAAERHVLTGDAAAGFGTDWTGRFRGETPASVRPRDTAEVVPSLTRPDRLGAASLGGPFRPSMGSGRSRRGGCR